MTEILVRIVDSLILALTILVFVRIALSWLFMLAPGTSNNNAINTLANLTFQLTEPVLGPIRRILPTFGMLDLSPMVVLLLLWLIRELLHAVV